MSDDVLNDGHERWPVGCTNTASEWGEPCYCDACRSWRRKMKMRHQAEAVDFMMILEKECRELAKGEPPA